VKSLKILKVKGGTSENVKCQQRMCYSNIHNYFNYLVLFLTPSVDAESRRIMIIPTFLFYNFPFIITVINL